MKIRANGNGREIFPWITKIQQPMMIQLQTTERKVYEINIKQIGPQISTKKKNAEKNRRKDFERKIAKKNTSCKITAM